MSVGILAVVVVAALRGLPQIWYHRTTMWDKTPPWWLWGDDFFHGFIRGGLIATVAIALADGAVTVYGIDGGQVPNNAKPLTIIEYVLSGLFLVALIMNVTVVFYNRPKFLVPPHLRDEPGAVASSRARAAARRRRAQQRHRAS